MKIFSTPEAFPEAHRSEAGLPSSSPALNFVPLHLSALGSCQILAGELLQLSDKVSPKRLNEFILGRAAAHRALASAGYDGALPILIAANRAPVWPHGFVGSITHCGEWAIAAVAKCDFVRAIGIDLEDPAAVQKNEIVERVCNEVERQWISDEKDAARRLAMIFSAKESVYKALNPLCHRFFDFHDVQLEWRPESRNFLGKLRVSLAPDFREGFEIEVGCQEWRGLIFTLAACPAGG